MTDTGAQQQPAGLQPCGTHGAYQRHVRAKEDACDACKAANAAYMKGRRDAWPGYLDRAVRSAKARQAALRLLAERHPGEFEALLEAARWEAGL